jgi:hypothetical protein
MPLKFGRVYMDYKELFGELAEQVESVVKEKGINLIVDNKEKPEYIPKTRFDELIGSKNELKAQVGELTNQLETLKKSAIGNEDLTKKIEELQKANEGWENKYRHSNITSQIKVVAMKEKARDYEDLIRFMDVDKLELSDEGTVKGLDEQLKALRENKPYLFEMTESNQPKPNQNGINPPVGGTNLKTIHEQIADAQAKGNTFLAIKLKNQLYKL